jgi:hypothetical protein
MSAMQKIPVYTSPDLADLLETWLTVGDQNNTSDRVTFHVAEAGTVERAGAQA